MAGGEEHRLEPGVFARVGPTETRKLVTGDEGAIGARARRQSRAQAFESTKFTDEGEPDPLDG